VVVEVGESRADLACSASAKGQLGCRGVPSTKRQLSGWGRSGRRKPVACALLVVVGSAVTVTEAIRSHTSRVPRWPRWSVEVDGLVARGARRWRWLVDRPRVVDILDRLAGWSRRFDQRLQADVDELSDRGEELLAYAELVRWRSRRIVERALSTVPHRLRAGLGRALGAIDPATGLTNHVGSVMFLLGCTARSVGSTGLASPPCLAGDVPVYHSRFPEMVFQRAIG
jgi:hypothetical protein